jgi:hypothetical protein
LWRVIASSGEEIAYKAIELLKEVQRPESENTLPGVLIAFKQQYIEFSLELYQMGSDLQHNNLLEI